SASPGSTSCAIPQRPRSSARGWHRAGASRHPDDCRWVGADQAQVVRHAEGEGISGTVGVSEARIGPGEARTGWGNLFSSRYWLLVLPAFAFFFVFFVIPVVLLFAIAFNPSVAGVVRFTPSLSLENFERFFGSSLYYGAALRSVVLACVVSFFTLLLGYPLAYFVAKTKSPRRNTFYMILILVSMQLDIVIRM